MYGWKAKLSRESECLRIFDEGLFTESGGYKKMYRLREEQAKKIIFSSLQKKGIWTPYYGVAASNERCY